MVKSGVEDADAAAVIIVGGLEPVAGSFGTHVAGGGMDLVDRPRPR
jgi:hypothetical protein